MRSNSPLIVNEKTYDKFALNLAISTHYKQDGNADATVSVRLRPCRVDAGVVEVLEDIESSQIVLLGGLAGMDDATAVAVSKVTAALQEFIDAKGL